VQIPAGKEKINHGRGVVFFVEAVRAEMSPAFSVSAGVVQ
jgi:hypothetical protein